MKKHDIIIIGAGASGLMAASRFKDQNIAIIEGNTKIAEKIKISGGGKCNVTNQNICADNYLGDHDFIGKVLKYFTQTDLLDFLKAHGLEPIVRKDQQYFFKDSAGELIALLAGLCQGIPIYKGQKVVDVTKNEYFIIRTNQEIYQAKKLVVASGGLSYPKIGATDIAFKIAAHFGHHVTRLQPALVGFSLQPAQFWMKALSGISFPVTICVAEKIFTNDMLFTHKGISGPVVLNASLYWQKGEIAIDFLPNIAFDKLLQGGQKQISTVLKLPKRFSKAFLESIALSDKSIAKLTDAEIEKLRSLKSYRFAPAGNFGYSKAEATSGGVDTNEIDVQTMESKKCEGLYFLGECLDVTGELGGYNFQWAFSSAQKLVLNSDIKGYK